MVDICYIFGFNFLRWKLKNYIFSYDLVRMRVRDLVLSIRGVYMILILRKGEFMEFVLVRGVVEFFCLGSDSGGRFEVLVFIILGFLFRGEYGDFFRVDF